MNKFIKRSVKFLVLIPIVWILGVCTYGLFVSKYLQKNIVRDINREHTIRRLNEVKTVDSVDVVVLGSSHAARGFDNRIFAAHGFTMFNLGTSAQSPIQSQFLVEKYIDQLKPKLVIYEASSMNFSSDGLESSIDLYHSIDTPDISLIKMVLQVNKIKSYNTFVFGVFERYILKKSPNDIQTNGDERDKYIKGGFLSTTRVADLGAQQGVISTLRKHRSTLKNYQVRAFEETMKYLAQRKINVVVVQAPVIKDLYKSISNQDGVDSLLSSFKNVNYYNFNKILKLDNQYFYDHQHLTQEGVSIFNEKFLAYLKRDNIAH